jgi:hypothetical protein
VIRAPCTRMRSLTQSRGEVTVLAMAPADAPAAKSTALLGTSRESGEARDDCDRTTSKMRGLSPKIILGDSRRIENAQTHTNKHTIPNMKFKLKLLQIKCHVLGFTKDKAQDVLQNIIRVCGSVRLSR